MSSRTIPCVACSTMESRKMIFRPFNSNVNSTPLFLILVFLSIQVTQTCYIHDKRSDINIEGYDPKQVFHNVCIDNTTIQPEEPSSTPPARYIFIRRCCGCRVSDATVKTITLTTSTWPEYRHTFYFTDIKQCECIQCDFDTHAHHRYLQELRH